MTASPRPIVGPTRGRRPPLSFVALPVGVHLFGDADQRRTRLAVLRHPRSRSPLTMKPSPRGWLPAYRSRWTDPPCSPPDLPAGSPETPLSSTHGPCKGVRRCR